MPICDGCGRASQGISDSAAPRHIARAPLRLARPQRRTPDGDKARVVLACTLVITASPRGYITSTLTSVFTSMATSARLSGRCTKGAGSFTDSQHCGGKEASVWRSDWTCCVISLRLAFLPAVQQCAAMSHPVRSQHCTSPAEFCRTQTGVA